MAASTAPGRLFESLALSATPSRPAAPGPADAYPVDTSVLEELALEEIEDLGPVREQVWLAEVMLRQDLGLEGVRRPRTPAEEQAVRRRAVLLFTVLGVAAPALKSLTQLADPAQYLAGTATHIVGHVDRAIDAYVEAVNVAIEGDADPALKALDLGDQRAADLPSVVLARYISPGGINELIVRLDPLRRAVAGMRAQSGRTTVKRLADRLAGFDQPETDPYDRRLMFRLNQVQAAWAAEKATKIRLRSTSQQMRSLLVDAQVAVAAGSVLAAYEQLVLWEKQLDEDADIATPARERLDQHLKEIEKYATTTLPEAERRKGLLDGTAAAFAYLASSEYADVVDRIISEFELEAFLDQALTLLVITGAAAITAGMAASVAGAVLAGMLEGVAIGTAATGFVVWAGSLVVETLVFGLVSELGSEFFYGPPAVRASATQDFAVTMLTFIVLKASARGWGAFVERFAAKRLADSALFVQGGRVAAGMVTMHAFTEAHAYVEHGAAMSSGKRWNSIVQNVLMTVGLELGMYIGRPLTVRLAAVAQKLERHPALRDPYLALERDREALQPMLDRMRSGEASAQELAATLEHLQRVVNEELRLIDAVIEPGAQAELNAAIAGHRTMVARVQLQLAHAGVPTALNAEPPAFRPLGRRIVAYDPAAKETLDAFLAERDRTLKRSKRNPDIDYADLPTGERYYYVEQGAPAEKVARAERLAALAQEAERIGVEEQTLLTAREKLLDFLQGREQAVDELLASFRAENLANMVELIADPGWKKPPKKAFLKLLDDHPDAVFFGRAYGMDTLLNVFKALNFRNYEVWNRPTDAGLQRATGAIEAAPTPEARAAVLTTLRTGTEAQVKALLGVAKKKFIRAPQLNRKEVGIDRSRVDWKEVHLKKATRYATEHGEVLTPEQLGMRADILQIQANAEYRRYGKWSWNDRLKVLDKVEQLGKDSLLDRGPLNSRRGSISEWLFNPQRHLPKRVFLDRIEVPGRAPEGSTIPDFFVKHADHVEWFNQKSDIRVVQGMRDAVAAAREYLQIAIEREARNIPVGDTYSLHFVRTPEASVREAMTRILLGPGSPIKRVIFGELPPSPVVVLPDQPVVVIPPK
ncbi:MAG TPA: hypothetical protein VGW75_16790 [Solirubrobacteraceae bacterium]|nr:hypothetical protein [Solirubrobacteraceae bacterium]